MICSFTGHRDMKEFSEELFVKTLEHLIQNEKVDVFYDGMARGFDLYAAKKVIELKKKYPRIGLVACIPYGGQIEGMKGGDREIYEWVLENCDDIRVLSPVYYAGCLLARNRYMVDNSSIVFAHYREGERGGTYYTLKYAESKGKQLYII